MLVFLGLSCLLGLTLAAPSGKKVVDNTAIYNGIFDRMDTIQKDGILTKAELDNVVKAFDTDKDGKATKTEGVPVAKALLSFGDNNAAAYFALIDKNRDGELNGEDAKMLYTFFDSNDDGQVNKPEFAMAIHKILRATPFIALYQSASGNSGSPAPFANIKAVLNGLDQNMDGKVQPAELQLVLDGPAGLDFKLIAEAYVKILDTDADGALGPADFDNFNMSLDKNGDKALDFTEMLGIGNLLESRSRGSN